MAVRPGADAHERRICRRLEARGQPGLGEALSRLRGCIVGGRWRVGHLYAVGAEGAVFVVSDIRDPGAVPKVGKIALLPYHLPAELSSGDLRRHRNALRTEARDLGRSASPYMPQSYGLHELVNPLLDVRRGGAFAEPEPILLMERLAGFDVDLWLARVHRSGIPRAILRPHLDRVAVVLLRALHDLQERGYLYADLRPGNLRVLGRPARRIRLLDAGSLVEVGDTSGKFPHVPSYLPPDLFRAYHVDQKPIVPTAAAQSVMAGRTLYEAATGIVPVPGERVDIKRLAESGVSAPVADVIDGLVAGAFPNVVTALKYLSRRAAQRVATTPVVAARPATAAAIAKPALEFASPATPAPVRVAPVPAPVVKPAPLAPAASVPVRAAPPAPAPAPVAPAPVKVVPATPAPALVPATAPPVAPVPVAAHATPAAVPVAPKRVVRVTRVPAAPPTPAPSVPVTAPPLEFAEAAPPPPVTPMPVVPTPLPVRPVTTRTTPVTPAPVKPAAAAPAPVAVPTAKATPVAPAPTPAKPVPAAAAAATPVPARTTPAKPAPRPATPAVARATPATPAPVRAAPAKAAPASATPAKTPAPRTVPGRTAPPPAVPAKAALSRAPAPAATPARPATPAHRAAPRPAPVPAALAPRSALPRPSLVSRLLDALFPWRRARRPAPRRVVGRPPLAGSTRL